ncbi:hypothetical protein ACFLSE_02695 [Bacteroidota bacterium]
MIFDNRDNVMKLNIRRFLAILIYLTLMVLLAFSDVFRNTIIGLNKSVYIILVTLLYILYIVFAYVVNYNYFIYNDEGDKLVFRFVSLRPFDNKKQAIEIHKKDFKGYKFQKSFINFKEDLILMIKTKKGFANYPPISVSALSIKHKNMLIQSLNQFV